MGRIGRTYPRFDVPNKDGDAERNQTVRSPLTGQDIAMTVIWVLGILAVLTWVVRLYR
jgi:hypothetical protein